MFYKKILTFASPCIKRAAKRAREKYMVHRSTAAVGRTAIDSKIHNNSKANAIR